MFGGLALVFIAVAVYRLYLNQMLQIRWRRWLTGRYLGDWLENQTYYRLAFAGTGTDHPDQRIAEDLRGFVQMTLSLSLGFLTNIVSLASFLVHPVEPVGRGSPCPGSASSCPATWCGWRWPMRSPAPGSPTASASRWPGSASTRERYEADFRFALVRLRENAESIALQQGEAQEARGFDGRFANVVANWLGTDAHAEAGWSGSPPPTARSPSSFPSWSPLPAISAAPCRWDR